MLRICNGIRMSSIVKYLLDNGKNAVWQKKNLLKEMYMIK